MKIATMFKDGLLGCEVGMAYYLRTPYCLSLEDLVSIEKASIDEMFIDFTKAIREVLLQRYPHIAQVPTDAVQGVDTPLPPPPPILWDGLGSLIPVNPPPISAKGGIGEKEDEIGSSSTGHQTHVEDMTSNEFRGNIEEKVDVDLSPGMEDSQVTWHDVALSIAAEMMQKAREEVRVNLGYSTSAVSQSLALRPGST
jgi:DNA polymerase eta